MINDLIKLANHLDSIGYTKEADELDRIISRANLDDQKIIVYVKIHQAKLSDDASPLFYGEIRIGENKQDGQAEVERFEGKTIEEVRDAIFNRLNYTNVLTLQDTLDGMEQNAYRAVHEFQKGTKLFFVDMNSSDAAIHALGEVADDNFGN